MPGPAGQQQLGEEGEGETLGDHVRPSLHLGLWGDLLSPYHQLHPLPVLPLRLHLAIHLPLSLRQPEQAVQVPARRMSEVLPQTLSSQGSQSTSYRRETLLLSLPGLSENIRQVRSEKLIHKTSQPSIEERRAVPSQERTLRAEEFRLPAL